jgi:hypothetical protein
MTLFSSVKTVPVVQNLRSTIDQYLTGVISYLTRRTDTRDTLPRLTGTVQTPDGYVYRPVL